MPKSSIAKKSTESSTKRKRKAATNALREIRNEQKRTSLIIPVAPFNRVVAETAGSHRRDLRFKGAAYKALHVAAEEYLIDVFQKANRCAIHDNRETVQTKDLKLATELGAV